jgi:hypothetical protein
MGFSWVVIKMAFLSRHNFGNPLCALLTDSVGYVVFAIILCKLLHYSLIGNFRLRCTMVGGYARSRSASYRMKPTGAERDGREGGTAERASQTPSPTSIRGNNGTGLPTTCPSGSLPHSASASENRSSFPLSSIFQFS